MANKDEIWKKVKMKEHYHGKIHVVEKDENGNERDTGVFIYLKLREPRIDACV